MARGNRKRLLLALAGIGLSPAMAGELTVTVSSVNGAPVDRAVISLRADSVENAATPVPAATIDQQGKQFRPWVLAARTGAPIGFSNHDNITHHVYSFSPARRFSFRLQSGEEHAPITFDSPGVVVLGCNIHDWMVGYVHVTDADFTATTDPAGTAHFTALPAAEWRLEVWHPGLAGKEPAAIVTLEAGQVRRIGIRLEQALRETGPREPLDDAGYSLP